MIPFKFIRVGPFDLAIKQLTGEERDKCLGMFSETQMAILMRDHYASDQQESETLLHEVLHAVWAVAGCKPKDPEERVISQMSTVLATVIRDNPDLIEFLKERLS